MEATVLHQFSVCPHSRAVRWALLHKQVEHDAVEAPLLLRRALGAVQQAGGARRGRGAAVAPPGAAPHLRTDLAAGAGARGPRLPTPARDPAAPRVAVPGAAAGAARSRRPGGVLLPVPLGGS